MVGRVSDQGQQGPLWEGEVHDATGWGFLLRSAPHLPWPRCGPRGYTCGQGGAGGGAGAAGEPGAWRGRGGVLAQAPQGHPQTHRGQVAGAPGLWAMWEQVGAHSPATPPAPQLPGGTTPRRSPGREPQADTSPGRGHVPSGTGVWHGAAAGDEAAGARPRRGCPPETGRRPFPLCAAGLSRALPLPPPLPPARAPAPAANTPGAPGRGLGG